MGCKEMEEKINQELQQALKDIKATEDRAVAAEQRVEQSDAALIEAETRIKELEDLLVLEKIAGAKEVDRLYTQMEEMEKRFTQSAGKGTNTKKVEPVDKHIYVCIQKCHFHDILWSVDDETGYLKGIEKHSDPKKPDYWFEKTEQK